MDSSGELAAHGLTWCQQLYCRPDRMLTQVFRVTDKSMLPVSAVCLRLQLDFSASLVSHALGWCHLGCC